VKYDFLHLIPPLAPPTTTREITDETGWINVNDATGQVLF
jgi:hypothetical protein